MYSVLRLALQTGKQVEIMYETKSGLISKRTIRVFTLRHERIIAYCYLRGHIRNFDINRVLAIEISKKTMEVIV